MTQCGNVYGVGDELSWWGTDDEPLDDGDRMHRIHCHACMNVLLIHGDDTMDQVKARLDQHTAACAGKDT